MYYNKKGDWDSFKNIILLLLVAAILIPLTYIILNEGSREAEIAACKNWAILQSATKVVSGPAGIPIVNINVPCMTFHDEAKKDKDIIYKTIADGMYDVWNMYGRGEIDFLSDKSFLGRLKSNIFCFIGDEISFDENTEIKQINIDDFEDYLSHNYPDKSESTYSEFLLNAENADIDFGDGTIEISPSERLYIIYAVEKKASSDLKDVLINTGKGALYSFFTISLSKSSLTGKKVTGRVLAGGKKFTGKILSGKGGLILGTLGTIGYVASDQSVMIPSLLVIQGDDIIKAGCKEGIHYKPKSKKEELRFKNE